MMAGFEPPAGRRSYIDQGFVSPNRQQQIPRPPIKHFSSGNPQENINTGAPQPQHSSGGLSFFSFRKRSNPPASSPVAETASSHHSSAYSVHQNGSQTSVGPAAPPHSRRLSSKELAPIGSSGGMSSANTSSSHEVMLVDPYSMPREVPETKPTTNSAPLPSPPQQRPTHSSNPSTSSVASAATTATTRPRPLHPELRSLITLNAARK